MLKLSVITQDTIEPVPVALARSHVRVDGSDEDLLLAVYITAARERCEVFTGRTITARTYKLKAAKFADVSHLPGGPVNAISSVTFYNTNDVLMTLGSAVYQLDGDAFSLAYGHSWPDTSGNGIIINYSAGYTSATCPGGLKAAILLYVGDLFAVREAQIVGVSAQRNEAAEALLWPFVINPLGLVLVTD